MEKEKRSIFDRLLFAIAHRFGKENKSMLLLVQNAASICYMIQYLLLGALTAAGTNAITLLRGVILDRYAKKEKEIPVSWLLLYCGLIIAVSAYTYKGLMSFIPMFMCIADGIATWHKEPKVYRVVSIFRALAWFAYNFTVHAYVGA